VRAALKGPDALLRLPSERWRLERDTWSLTHTLYQYVHRRSTFHLRGTMLTLDGAAGRTVNGRRRLTADDTAMEDAATPPEAWTDYASINKQFARSPALQELLVRTGARQRHWRVTELFLMGRTLGIPWDATRCSWCARGWNRLRVRCSRSRSARSTGKTPCGTRRSASQATVSRRC